MSSPRAVRLTSRTLTPIRVTHYFSLYIYFSIQGEDLQGQPLKQDGPGELRLLIIKTPVIVPSVSLDQ